MVVPPVNKAVRMAVWQQEFPRPSIADPAQAARQEVAKLAGALLKPGMKVGITVGSRGIAALTAVVTSLVDFLKEAGCHPVILASMGSHGGGTAAGQQHVLAALGIVPEAVGAPILADPETVFLGKTEHGFPVYVLKRALELDGIIVFNRIKPHTAFHGPVESGLLKMLAVGLGGPRGAAVIHSRGGEGMADLVLEVGSYLAAHLPLLCGLAVLENAYGEVARVEAIAPGEFRRREEALLHEARQLLPRLPFEEIDILIVEEMGKCYSGTGMDTNVIGRLRQGYQPEPASPRVRRLVVLDLAAASQGNANGIGLADFTTEALVKKIDRQATYLNALTTGFPQRAMLPLVYPTELEAVAAAYYSLGEPPVEEVKVVQIANTSTLDKLALSEALWSTAKANSRLNLVGHSYWLALGGAGSIPRLT